MHHLTAIEARMKPDDCRVWRWLRQSALAAPEASVQVPGGLQRGYQSHWSSGTPAAWA